MVVAVFPENVERLEHMHCCGNCSMVGAEASPHRKPVLIQHCGREVDCECKEANLIKVCHIADALGAISLEGKIYLNRAVIGSNKSASHGLHGLCYFAGSVPSMLDFLGNRVIRIPHDSFRRPPMEQGVPFYQVGLIGEGGTSPVEGFGEFRRWRNS